MSKQRPLSDQEILSARAVLSATGWLLDHYDSLKSTSLYRGNVRLTAKKFFSELGRFERQLVDRQPGESDQQASAAALQADYLYEFMDHNLRLSLEMADLEIQQQENLDRDFRALLGKYHLTIPEPVSENPLQHVLDKTLDKNNHHD